MRIQAWYLLLGLTLVAPLLAGNDAVIQGKLPPGMTVRLDAQYLSRLWKPAVSLNPVLPIPIPYKDHFSKSFEVSATADAHGHYRLEFPMELAGRLTTYRFDAAYLTFSMDGKTFNLPTWMVPTFRPSKHLGRANLAVGDVEKLVIETSARSPDVHITRIRMNDGVVYTGHHLGFPDSEEGAVATIDIESATTR